MLPLRSITSLFLGSGMADVSKLPLGTVVQPERNTPARTMSTICIAANLITLARTQHVLDQSGPYSSVWKRKSTHQRYLSLNAFNLSTAFVLPESICSDFS